MTYLWLLPLIVAIGFIGVAVREYFKQRLEGVVDIVLAVIFLIVAFLCFLLEKYVNLGTAAIFLIVLSALGWAKK